MDTKQHYNSIARQYSELRPPIGSDVIAAMIKYRISKDAKEIRVLDAGCGTGRFTKSLIKDGIRHVTLLDAAEGMLSQAKENLAEEIQLGYIDNMIHDSLPTFSFDDHSFDVVIFSLVLDFLAVTSPTGTDFSGITKTLQETRRVLAPCGMIAILTVSTRAIVDSVWFTKFIPETAVKRFMKKYPTIPEWESIFDESGFQCVNKISLLGPEVNGKWLNDSEAPLNKEWRNSATIWKMLTDEELQATERRLEDIMRTSSLAQFKKEHDKTNEIGSVFGLEENSYFHCKWWRLREKMPRFKKKSSLTLHLKYQLKRKTFSSPSPFKPKKKQIGLNQVTRSLKYKNINKNKQKTY